MRETPLWRRYQRLWGQDAAADANEELDFHFSMRIRDLVAQGQTEDAARAQARREFGDVDRIRGELLLLGEERARQTQRASVRDALRQDVGTGLRALVRNRSFALLAIGTLGVGMGLSTAMFSVLHGVLLRPLPFRDSAQLVVMWNRYPQDGLERIPLSASEFSDVAAGSRSFESLTVASYREVNITADDEPERLAALEVSPDFFRTLGTGAALGRTFNAGDVQSGSRGAVLSHELWQRRYGSDQGIIGRVLMVDKQPIVVIGVMPADFELLNPASFLFPQRPALFLPLDVTALASESRGEKYLRVIGRIRPGVTREAVTSDMTALGARFSADNPGHYPDGWRLDVLSLSEQMLGRTRGSLLLVSVAVGFVLLIACINVSSLTIARMISRQREIAIRAALGAGRGRLVRQLLTENVTLSMLAGALGVVIAAVLVSLVRLQGPPGVPRIQSVHLDGTAVIVAIGVSIVTGIALGLVAAHAPAMCSIETALRGSGRNVAGGRRRVRSLLVICEIALACMVLIGTGLVVKSLLRVMTIDPGLRPEGVIALEIALPNSDYPNARARNALHDDALARLRAVPGVAAAAVVNPLPLSGDVAEAGFTVEGAELAEGEPAPTAPYASVSSGYFATLGIPLLRGRAITDADRADAPRVVVVDATFARRHWPGQDAIGKRIHMGGTPDTVWTTVVGVAAPVASAALEAERHPHMYLPMAQRTRASATLLVRATSGGPALSTALRAAVRASAPNLPIPALRTMNSIIDASVAGRRFSAMLLFAFGVIALLLATLGLYGLIAYTVGQRTREIGVRMALGARSGDAIRMVLTEGFALAAIGIAVGLAGALAFGQVVTRFLYGVTATDPATYVGVALLLLLVAIAASWAPARRAARVPPLIALRGE